MKPELEKYKYMIDYEGSERNPLFLYGIECGPGWMPHIISLLDMIMVLDLKRKVRIFQIKEKFGTFRFYYNSRDLKDLSYGQSIENQITLYTTKLDTTCERCGDIGTQKTKGGWIKCSCDKCME